MASIKKRGNKWQIRVSYKDSDGINRTKSKSGFTTKREAEIYAADLQTQSFNDEIAVNGKVTLYDYFSDWYKLYKKPSLSYRTKLQYEHTKSVIQKYFGNSMLSKINRRQYQKFLTEYGSDHSKATVAKKNSHIRACVKNAIYDNIVKKDFTDQTTLVFDKTKTMEIDYLNLKELNEMINKLYDGIDPHFTSRYMIIVAAYSGLRLGELQGLQWQDVNFNFKTIAVNRSWNELNSEFKETKTASSIRIVRINQMIIDLLTELKEFCQPKNDNEQIFINQFGTVPTSAAVNKTLKKFVSHQGFHFHSLRHTHVAYLLSKHVDLYLISKRLGHSDIGTTSKVYSYLIDEYKIEGDNQIETALDDISQDTKKATSKIG